MMARWEPDARGRLEKAAMDLISGTRLRGDHGRGDCRARRSDGADFLPLLRRQARGAVLRVEGPRERHRRRHRERLPRDRVRCETVVAAFEAVGVQLQDRRDISYVRARYALVRNHAEIQERELIKLASLAVAATKALRARGVSEPAASLAAEAGIAVFKIGFERWVNERKRSNLAAHIRAAVDALRAVAAERSAPTKRPKAKQTRGA